MMLPITTEAVWSEIRRRRRIFKTEEIRRDLVALESENPYLYEYIAKVWRSLTAPLQQFGFAEAAAEELALIAADICIMLYTSLKKQAERDGLPPLPKVSQGLLRAFVERLEEFLNKTPREASKALERDPILLRNIWIMCGFYLTLLEQAAKEEKVPTEKLPGITYATFGLACGLYELLEEAEAVEELEKVIGR